MGYWLNVPFIQPTERVNAKLKDVHGAAGSYVVYKHWGKHT